MPNRSTLSQSTLVAIFMAAMSPLIGFSQNPASPNPNAYSDEVVAKAEKIITAAGLRRTGKTLVSVEAAEISRELNQLAKTRKSVKQLADGRKATEDQLKQVAEQFRLLDAQNGELNARLVQVAGDVIANNRLIGLINANGVKLRQLDEQRTNLREKLVADRRAVIEAETAYAESVVALREKLNELQSRLEPALAAAQWKVALRVFHATYQTPETLDLADIIGQLDRRLRVVEKEVVQDVIPLDTSPAGAILVNVAIGATTIPMILDSGASMVILPADTAIQVGVTPGPNAQPIRLLLADGRAIAASSAVIPKMRVGVFEAENVEAAVLEPNATGAEPLLGMTFLGNFKFEIDGPGKTLKLLRVGDQTGN